MLIPAPTAADHDYVEFRPETRHPDSTQFRGRVL
jgi:hypothetical protein